MSSKPDTPSSSLPSTRFGRLLDGLRPEVRAELETFADWLQLPKPKVPFDDYRDSRPVSTAEEIPSTRTFAEVAESNGAAVDRLAASPPSPGATP